MYVSLRKSKIPLKKTFYIRVCSRFLKYPVVLKDVTTAFNSTAKIGGPKIKTTSEPKFRSANREE